MIRPNVLKKKPAPEIEGLIEFRGISALSQCLEEAWRLRRTNFPDFIHFAVPGGRHYDGKYFFNTKRFVNVSITGQQCALMCDHCYGQMLKGMIPAITPEKLQELGIRLREQGVSGLLVSGGCNAEGQVPLKPFLPVLGSLKSLGLTVDVHTGLADREAAMGLKQAGVDKVFLDMIGDEETIHRIYHLDRSPSAYWHTLEVLLKEGLTVVPHVVLGLNYGNLMGEEQLFDELAAFNLESIVLVALRALPGTPMRMVKGPEPVEIIRLTAQARLKNPRSKISFGCARPGGEHKGLLERGVIAAGINALAFPLDETVDFSLAMGLSVRFSEDCCGGL